MEILKKKRRVIRAQATRIINEADEILAKQAPAPDIVAVSGLIERLLLVQKQLSDVNATIEPHIIDDDADAEFEQVMEYDDKIASCLGSMKSIGNSVADGPQIRNVVVLRASVTDQQTKPILRPFRELEGGEESNTPEKFPNVQIMEEFTKGIKSVDGRNEVRLPWREDVALEDMSYRAAV
ncbi:hypothetical protein HPB50_025230 [Hyalomma asiaticum]|uniref:Uncharacterized protein n=1 Tax=Hyalomma asiaticum TaxID=266040 RepID=A0ACB7TUH1_HYAAI|nr:hypothetical protein HPB50_025230 [Hyalomma asiaticum]